MSLAIEEAQLASRRLEVPVGAVLVRASTGEVLASHHNTVDEEDDPTAHAELKCIRDGAKRLGGWRYLAETTLYVTLEPCPMCAGAVLNARRSRVGRAEPAHRRRRKLAANHGRRRRRRRGGS
jgi:tRNA(adenine34) deaminase